MEIKYCERCGALLGMVAQKKLREKYRKSGKSGQYKKPERKKAKPKNKDYTIEEIKAKAKELGTTYGKVVLGLQLGTIDRW